MQGKETLLPNQRATLSPARQYLQALRRRGDRHRRMGRSPQPSPRQYFGQSLSHLKSVL